MSHQHTRRNFWKPWLAPALAVALGIGWFHLRSAPKILHPGSIRAVTLQELRNHRIVNQQNLTSSPIIRKLQNGFEHGTILARGTGFINCPAIGVRPGKNPPAIKNIQVVFQFRDRLRQTFTLDCAGAWYPLRLNNPRFTLSHPTDQLLRSLLPPSFASVIPKKVPPPTVRP